MRRLLESLSRLPFGIWYGIEWVGITEMAAREDYAGAWDRAVALRMKAGERWLPPKLTLFEGFLQYKLGRYPEALEKTINAYLDLKPGHGISATEARYLKCHARALGDLIGTKIKVKGGHHMTEDCATVDLNRVPVRTKKTFALWTHPEWEDLKGWK